MKTIDAMKQARNAMCEAYFVCGQRAVDSAVDLLDEAIAAEEAQTIEPAAEVVWGTFGLKLRSYTKLKEGDKLYTRPATAPSGERETLIATLLECLSGPAALTTREATAIKDAADMLASDAVIADKRVAAIAADREYWREQAQQVAVPQKPTHYADALGRLHTADRARFLGLDTDHLLWLYAAPQPPQAAAQGAQQIPMAELSDGEIYYRMSKLINDLMNSVRVPMTDAEIDDLWKVWLTKDHGAVTKTEARIFARIVEAHCGVKP